jgi:DNA-binding transcriptional ArsR family regulator
MSDFCTKVQQLGKGISNPARYKILETLMDGAKSVNELVAAVGLSQPAVSQHLATLRSCDLVEAPRKARK